MLNNIRKGIALFEGFKVSPNCPCGKMQAITEHWWNLTDRGKVEYSE
jgi:hypothetical protein